MSISTFCVVFVWSRESSWVQLTQFQMFIWFVCSTHIKRTAFQCAELYLLLSSALLNSSIHSGWTECAHRPFCITRCSHHCCPCPGFPFAVSSSPSHLWLLCLILVSLQSILPIVGLPPKEGSFFLLEDLITSEGCLDPGCSYYMES